MKVSVSDVKIPKQEESKITVCKFLRTQQMPHFTAFCPETGLWKMAFPLLLLHKILLNLTGQIDTDRCAIQWW